MADGDTACRVTVREGREPIVFVAPHGFQGDDKWTANIALHAAAKCQGFAVANHGWERANEVDPDRSKANCNNVNHMTGPVICEEFFEPIMRFQLRCQRKHGSCTFVFIHGLGEVTSDNYKNLDVVLGFGDGKPPSFTMALNQRLRLPRLFYDEGLGPYIGMAGGRYTGWAKPNMNQYWRKWVKDEDVDSVQIEVARKHRTDAATAYVFGNRLGEVFANYLADASPISSGTFPEI